MIRKYVQKESKLLLLNIMFAALAVVLMLTAAVTMGEIVDVAQRSNFRELVQYAVISVLLLLSLWLVNVVSKFFQSKFQANISIGIKNDIVQTLMNSSMEVFNAHGFDYYFNLISNDVETLRTGFLASISGVIINAIGTVVSSAFLISFHPVLFFISIVLSLLPLVISNLFLNPMEKANQNKSDANEHHIENMHELIYGLDLIKRSGKSRIFLDKFNENNAKLFQEIVRLDTVYTFANRGMWTMSSLIQVILIFLCAIFIMHGKMTPGTLVSVVILVTYFSEYITNFINNLMEMRSYKPIINKLSPYLEDEKHPKRNDMKAFDKKDNIETEMEGSNSAISFQNVDFSFDDKTIFDELSFEVFKNQCMAIIGKSGVGKSTLIKLILKFYMSYTGDIYVENKNLRDIEETELYKDVYLVPQDSYIFKMSLFHNVSMYDEATEDNLKHVEKILDFMNLKHLIDVYGLNDKSLEADNLSGGEKKRISIARGLYQRSRILLFDEPTASLDPVQTEKINELIFNMEGVTRLVVTHNWDTEYLEKFDSVLRLS